MAHPIEQRIEQESKRDEQRPAQHAPRKRHVEQHQQREDHRVVDVHQGCQPEERAEHQARRELAGRALRVQGADERLDELEKCKHRAKSLGDRAAK